eukprot:6753074-Pyramimonas_sp.AAC.1
MSFADRVELFRTAVLLHKMFDASRIPTSDPLSGIVLGDAGKIKHFPSSPSKSDAQANYGDQGSEGAYRVAT